MHITTLRYVMALNRLSQSDVARLAGVSRQAVSLWFKGNKSELINVPIATALRFSAAVMLPLDDLTKSIPVLEKPELEENLRAEFLWDGIFPSLADFVRALVNEELRAIARLVQCAGLFEAAHILGDSVWNKFHSYKQFIIPVRRKGLESLWTMQKDLNLI